jgi:hypothetical protein
MIVEYGAILKVDFRRLGLSQRKSEFFNTIGQKRTIARSPKLSLEWSLISESCRMDYSSISDEAGVLLF